MTVTEALNLVKAIKPNQYTDAVLVSLLSELDGRVWHDMMQYHEDAPEEPESYDATSDAEATLLIPHPYDDAYVTYLGARIDYMNAEVGRYNNGMLLFNQQLGDFYAYWNREHMVVPRTDVRC